MKYPVYSIYRAQAICNISLFPFFICCDTLCTICAFLQALERKYAQYVYTRIVVRACVPTCMHVNMHSVLFMHPSLWPQSHLQRQQEAEQACQIAIRQVNGSSSLSRPPPKPLSRYQLKSGGGGGGEAARGNPPRAVMI